MNQQNGIILAIWAKFLTILQHNLEILVAGRVASVAEAICEMGSSLPAIRQI